MDCGRFGVRFHVDQFCGQGGRRSGERTDHAGTAIESYSIRPVGQRLLSIVFRLRRSGWISRQSPQHEDDHVPHGYHLVGGVVADECDFEFSLVGEQPDHPGRS